MQQTKKLRVLPPTLRERERYIKFQIISEEKIEYTDLEEAIWNIFLDFFGENEVGRFNLKIVKNLWNDNSQIGVMKCNHISLPKVLAGLGLISRLGDNRIIFKILKISGTIKGLKINE
ncbi:MAG: Rpp14/Pop5 family protein [Candidatus Aenigmatarchaeota archaeon]